MNAIKAVSGTFANQDGMIIEDKIFSVSVNFFLFFIHPIDLVVVGIAVSAISTSWLHTKIKTVSMSRHLPCSKAGFVLNPNFTVS